MLKTKKKYIYTVLICSVTQIENIFFLMLVPLNEICDPV